MPLLTSCLHLNLLDQFQGASLFGVRRGDDLKGLCSLW